MKKDFYAYARRVKSMDFQKITLDDIEKIKPFFNTLTSSTCDFTVGGMFMWRDYYGMEYLIEDGIFFSRLKDAQGNIYYNLPISDNVENALRENISRYRKGCEKIRFCTVPEAYLPAFLSVAPSASVTEQTDYFDYIYNAADLIELKGRKYQPQRNLVSQFKRNNPDWSFVDINTLPIERVIEFFISQGLSGEDDGTASVENMMVLEVLSNMDKYGFVGGVLMLGERVVGFSLGEKLGDTLFTHVEKADRSFKGAYQTLTNQFALTFGADARFINREEDMGDAGLRRAKNAYHPIALLKKYIVEVD